MILTGGIYSPGETPRAIPYKSPFFEKVIAIWPKLRSQLENFDIESWSPTTNESRVKVFHRFIDFFQEHMNTSVTTEQFFICIKHAKTLVKAEELALDEKKVLMKVLYLHFSYQHEAGKSDEEREAISRDFLDLLEWNASEEERKKWEYATLLSWLERVSSDKKAFARDTALLFRRPPFNGFYRSLVIQHFLAVLAKTSINDSDEIYQDFSTQFQINSEWLSDAQIVCRIHLRKMVARLGQNPESWDYMEVYGRAIELNQLLTWQKGGDLTHRFALDLIEEFQRQYLKSNPFVRDMVLKLLLAILSKEGTKETQELINNILTWAQLDLHGALAVAHVAIKHQTQNKPVVIACCQLVLTARPKPTLGVFKAVLEGLLCVRVGDWPKDVLDTQKGFLLQFIDKGFSLNPLEFELQTERQPPRLDTWSRARYYSEGVNELIRDVLLHFQIDEPHLPCPLFDLWLEALSSLSRKKIVCVKGPTPLSKGAQRDIAALIEDYTQQKHVYLNDYMKEVLVRILESPAMDPLSFNRLLDLLCKGNPECWTAEKPLLIRLIQKDVALDTNFLISKFREKNLECDWENQNDCYEHYTYTLYAKNTKVWILIEHYHLESIILLLWTKVVIQTIKELPKRHFEREFCIGIKEDLYLLLKTFCKLYANIEPPSSEDVMEMSLHPLCNDRLFHDSDESVIIYKQGKFLICHENQEALLYPLPQKIPSLNATKENTTPSNFG